MQNYVNDVADVRCRLKGRQQQKKSIKTMDIILVNES